MSGAPPRAVKPLPAWIRGLLAWGSDRINPMLIRCVRQELRSRAFLAGYILALAVAMVAALIAAKTSADDIERGQEAAYGLALFLSLSVVWSFILVPVQAIIAFRTITLERQHDTWDLVELTGMRPGRILRGLLLTTVVQSMLYTTALAPYMMLAYLLRGIDLMQIAATMVLVIGCGIACSAAGALAGTLAQGKHGKGLLGFVVGAGSLFVWFMLQSLLWNALGSELSDLFRRLIEFDGGAWLAVGISVNSWLAAVVLAMVLGSAQLAHRAGDRSSAPRTAMLLILVILMLGIALMTAVETGFDLGDMFAVWSIILALAAATLGFFSTTEDVALSPRQARVIGEAQGLQGLRMAVCGPGANRGHRVFLLLALGAVLCAGAGLANDAEWWPCYFSLLVVSYAAICFGLNDLVLRSGVIPGIETPLHRRAILFALIMASSLLPMLGALISSGMHDPFRNALIYFSPFFGTIATLSTSQTNADGAMLGIGIFGLLGALRCLIMAGQGGLRTKRVRARADDANPRGG